MSTSAKRMLKLRQSQSEDEVKAQREKNAQRMRDKRAAQKNAKMDDSKNLEKKMPTEVSSMDESSSLAADDSGFGKMTLQASWNTPRRSAENMAKLDIENQLNLNRKSLSEFGITLPSDIIEHISWVVTRYADANSCPEKSHYLSQNSKRNSSSRYSSPDDDSQCGDDSSQQLSLGLLHAMNLFRFSYSVMQLRGAFFSGCFDLSIEKRNFLLRSSSPDDDSQCGDDSSLQLNVGLMHTKNLFLSSCSMMHLRNTHLPVVLILSTETVMDFSFGNVDRHGSSTLRWIGSVASQSVYL